MATEEEVFTYIMKVQGEEDLKKSAAAAALAEQKFQALYSTLGAGDPQTRAAAAALVDLQRPLAGAQASSRDLGRATLEASRGLEDLQYGVAGVLNNLPSLVASLGGGAGLAGVVSLVAVGGKVLYDHWGDLAGLFGQGHTKTEAERMEELGKKTGKTADETARLLKYEEARKHLDAQNQKPEATTAYGKAVDKAISEGPVDEVNKGLDKHFRNEIRARADIRDVGGVAAKKLRDAEEAERLSLIPGNPGNTPTRQAQVRAQKKAAEDEMNRLYGEGRDEFRSKVLTDPRNAGTAKRVADAARANPGDFGPEGEKFAAGLDAAIDPQASQRKKIADAFGKIVDKIAEKLPKLAEEAQKKVDDAARKVKHEAEKQAKQEEAEDRHQDQVEESSRNRLVEWQEKGRVEAEDKAQKKLEQRATTGTGLDAQGEMAMLRSMLSGGSRDQITARVTQELTAKFMRDGIDPGRAHEMASEKAEGWYGGVGDDIAGRVMKGPEMRPVEHADVGDFARSVESQGAKKMESLTEEMKGVLVEIRNQTRNYGKIGP